MKKKFIGLVNATIVTLGLLVVDGSNGVVFKSKAAEDPVLGNLKVVLNLADRSADDPPYSLKVQDPFMLYLVLQLFEKK
ncbi:hypothetical protein [Paenibacillus sp. 32352]|uniref:hypothetical protein n=1 Tax=Paenibacillus sp. 32352 TaxID=1969111 RepID=UPI0009ACC1A1|nr:hypothetical protein [Paenibacillus sp. 32352]